MTSPALRRELRQTKPFSSLEEAALIGLQLAAHRVWDPWARFLKAEAKLSPHQHNVLRILRGAGVAGHSSGAIAERMITRDPDVTRLVDKLTKRGLVRRIREEKDRRVVRVFITRAGLELLERLDEPVREMPKRLLDALGEARLQQLNRLLDAVIREVGTYP